MKVLSSGVSICLLTAMVSLSIHPLPKVLAQEVHLVAQAPSTSAQQQALGNIDDIDKAYKLAQVAVDPHELWVQSNKLPTV